VIVIISVVTALVVPSMFSNSSDNGADETLRLQQVMRLAVDEAQLTGTPLRWWARKDRYGFEKRNNQQWQQLTAGVFAIRKLKGVVIDRVIENGVDQQIEEDGAGTSNQAKQDFFASSQQASEPLIGRVLMLPNGMVTMVNVDLLERQGGQLHRLLIRPGPAGIVEEK